MLKEEGYDKVLSADEYTESVLNMGGLISEEFTGQMVHSKDTQFAMQGNHLGCSSCTHQVVLIDKDFFYIFDLSRTLSSQALA